MRKSISWLSILLPSLVLVQGFSLFPKNRATRPEQKSKPFLAFRNRETRVASRLAVSSTPDFEGNEFKRFSRTLELLDSNKSVIVSGLVVTAAAIVTGKWQIVPETLRFNVLSGTVIFSAGDYGAQLLEYHMANKESKASAVNGHQPEKPTFLLDSDRFVVSVVLGAVWAGVGNPLVYDTVEKILPGGGNLPRILLKMAMTCSILSTIGNYFTMMFRRVGKKLLEQFGSDSVKIVPTVRSCIKTCNGDFSEVLRDDLKIWPLYDILCYSVIPPKIRPVTTALMATLWSAYMSIASAKDHAPEGKNSGESEKTTGSERSPAEVQKQHQ